MAWSPFRRANAGIIWVAIPGDYANQISTTSATAPAAFYQEPALGRSFSSSAASSYSNSYSWNLMAYPRGFMITIDKTLIESPGSDNVPVPPTIDRPRQAAERLAACWSPPLPLEGDTVEVTIRLGFNNRGETLAPPHITYIKAARGTAIDDVRASISRAVEACRKDDENGPPAVAGARHGHRERTLTGTFGKTEISVPRARLMGEDGKTQEWKSKSLRAYRNRVALTTAYAAGLRIREVALLKVASIESARMLIHVEK
jgi:hypothetical protein